jgi:vancomycin resistance protein YoaR
MGTAVPGAMRIMVRRVAALVLGLALALSAGYVAWRRASQACWLGRSVCEGIRIAGQPLPAGADVDAFVRGRQAELSTRALRVVVEDVTDLVRSYTFEDLGVRMDLDGASRMVRSVGHTGPIGDRIEQARRARKGEVDIPLLLAVDPDVMARTLGPLKDAADELPVPARLDLGKRTVIPEVPGRFLDLDLLFEKVRAAASDGKGEVRLRRTEVKPRISSDVVAQIDLQKTLASYETRFSRAGDQASRAHNIENGVARLDGLILLPGEMFSFNAAVGPRTPENGFSKGWEIFKGEMVEGIGGGTCQVASTLHAAATFAGLDVLERLPHSRPSAYITMGLDATVVYPVVDLKLRNPFEFPVVVHAFVEGNAVTFQLLGKEKPVRVVFGRQVLATRAFARKVEEVPGMSPTRIVRKQHGLPGYKVCRTRTIAYADGTTKTESNIDIYPPVVEEYLVAPGVDLATLLPPLEGDVSDDAPAGWVRIGASREPGAAPAAGGSARPMASNEAPPGCTGDCQPAKIVNAPGAHAPTPQQLRAPVNVVLGGP